MGFVEGMDHNVAKHVMVSKSKNGGGTCLFEW